MSISTKHLLTLSVCCASRPIAITAETLLNEAVGRNLAAEGNEKFLLSYAYPPLTEEDVSKSRSCFVATITTTDLGALEIFENQARQALAFLGVEVA